jgi:hypothetical protein
MPTTVAGWGRARAAAAAALCLIVYGCGTAEPPKKEAVKKTEDRAPEVYRVNFDTSKGPFTVEVTRAWAPRGADHFYDLVKTGFYDNARFYRVVRNYVVQFGIAADPSANRLWGATAIPACKNPDGIPPGAGGPISAYLIETTDAQWKSFYVKTLDSGSPVII